MPILEVRGAPRVMASKEGALAPAVCRSMLRAPEVSDCDA